MSCTSQIKGRSQTSISWWHFRFLHELSQHPQLHTTPWISSHPPHTSLHPCLPAKAFTEFSKLAVAEADETLSMTALGTGFSSSIPAKQWEGHDYFLCYPQAQPMFGCTRCLPRVLVTSVECGCPWLSVCLRAWLVAIACSTVSSRTHFCSPWQWMYIKHTYIYMYYFSKWAWYFACAVTQGLVLTSPGAACRGLEIKTHPLPLVPHQTPKAFTLQNRFLWAFY